MLSRRGLFGFIAGAAIAGPAIAAASLKRYATGGVIGSLGDPMLVGEIPGESFAPKNMGLDIGAGDVSARWGVALDEKGCVTGFYELDGELYDRHGNAVGPDDYSQGCA